MVLGLGPGGEDAAGRLADAGISVAAIETRLVGGERPHGGCIPSKALVRAAGLLAEVPSWANRHAVECEARLGLPTLPSTPRCPPTCSVG